MKKETLEELAKDFYSDDDEMMLRIAFRRGYTECEERMYSEEEVLSIQKKYDEYIQKNFDPDFSILPFKVFFEQFKKK